MECLWDWRKNNNSKSQKFRNQFQRFFLKKQKISSHCFLEPPNIKLYRDIFWWPKAMIVISKFLTFFIGYTYRGPRSDINTQGYIWAYSKLFYSNKAGLISWKNQDEKISNYCSFSRLFCFTYFWCQTGIRQKQYNVKYWII